MKWVLPDIRIAPQRPVAFRPMDRAERDHVHPELAAAMMRALHARMADAGRPRHGEDTVVEREGAFPVSRFGHVFPRPDALTGHAFEPALRWEAAAMMAEAMGTPHPGPFAGAPVPAFAGQDGEGAPEPFSFALFMAICLERDPAAVTPAHDLRSACAGFCRAGPMEQPDDSTWGHAMAAAGFIKRRGGKAEKRRRFWKGVRLSVEGEIMRLLGEGA